MTTERLFAGVGQPNTNNDAHSPRAFSVNFTTSADTLLTGLGIRNPGPTLPATVSVALYEPSVSTTVPILTASGSPSSSGEFVVAVSHTILAGHTYTAVAGISLSGSSTQPDYGWDTTELASNVTTAHLTALAHSTRFENDIVGGAPYPSNTAAPDFWFGVLIEATFSSTVTLAGSAGASSGSTAAARVRHAVTGTASAGISASASARARVRLSGAAAAHSGADLSSGLVPGTLDFSLAGAGLHAFTVAPSLTAG